MDVSPSLTFYRHLGSGFFTSLSSVAVTQDFTRVRVEDIHFHAGKRTNSLNKAERDRETCDIESTNSSVNEVWGY